MITFLIAYSLLSFLLVHFLTVPKAPLPNSVPLLKENSFSKSDLVFILYNLELTYSILYLSYKLN